jgi:predicted nucleic acid-binding Zn ribbon protein
MSDDRADYERKLRSVERAIKRLANLLMQVDHKDLASWLIGGDKLGEGRAGDAWFVSEHLDWVCDQGIKEFELGKPVPKCLVCGESTRKFDSRSHTRYCSDKCRQKAYRERHGSHRKMTVKRNALSLGLVGRSTVHGTAHPDHDGLIETSWFVASVKKRQSFAKDECRSENQKAQTTYREVEPE